MGSLFVIIGGALWGAMGIFVRGLARCGLTSLEICAVRVSVSAVIMAVFISLHNSKLLKIKLEDIWCFVGTGVFSLTFFGYCYFTAIQMTSMSVAAVLLYTSPVFVLLFSAVLFGEKITLKKVGCIILALMGCIFVTGIVGGEGLNLPVLGILFGIGSGIGYALYSIFGRFALNRGYGALTITFYSFLFSSVALLFLVKPGVVVGKLLCGVGAENTDGMRAGGKAIVDITQTAETGVGSLGAINGDTIVNIMYMLGLAVFVTVLPYIFYTLGLSKIDNSKAAVIACIEPIMATLLGFLVFGESLSIMELIGVALVLISIVLMEIGNSK